MLSQRQNKTIVGLDIEAGGLAATELRMNGGAHVTKHGVTSLEPGIFQDGEVVDADALGDSMKKLFADHKLSRSVRLGVANQRVAVRMLDLPPIENAAELETAIRFTAQDHIPMPLEQAVLDWEVVAHTESENGERRLRAVVAAARRDMLAGMLDAARRANLRPVGIDVAAFGMIRALAPLAVAPASFAGPQAEAAPPPAKLYANLGDSVNLAVAQGSSCLFTRVSGFGLEGMAQRLAERRRLTLEHARQWVGHVGLATPVEEIAGDEEIVATAREVLAEGAGKLVDELRLSLEYYNGQPGAVPVDGVIVCGPGTAIPGLVEQLQAAFGFPFSIGRPQALSHLDDASAARLTLSYGIALEE